MNNELKEIKARLVEEQRKLLGSKEVYQDLKLKLDGSKREIGTLEDKLDRKARATRLALEAVMLLERRGDLESALGLADDALRQDHAMHLARRIKGRVLAASGLAREALDAFDLADDMAKKAGLPCDVKALVCAGETCLTDLGDRARALDYYRRAAELGTEPAYKLLAEARRLQLKGKLDEAAAKAEEARKADPSLSLASLVLGEALFEQATSRESVAERKAELKKADAELARALKLEPNSARGCLVRGRLLLEQARLAGASGFAIARLGPQGRAERLLTTAMNLKPRLPEAHLSLAELRLSDGALRDPASALMRAAEAVRLTDRKAAPALALLAKANAATGNLGGAVQVIKEAIQIDPKNREYMRELRRYEEGRRQLSP